MASDDSSRSSVQDWIGKGKKYGTGQSEILDDHLESLLEVPSDFQDDFFPCKSLNISQFTQFSFAIQTHGCRSHTGLSRGERWTGQSIDKMTGNAANATAAAKRNATRALTCHRQILQKHGLLADILAVRVLEVSPLAIASEPMGSGFGFALVDKEIMLVKVYKEKASRFALLPSHRFLCMLESEPTVIDDGVKVSKGDQRLFKGLCSSSTSILAAVKALGLRTSADPKCPFARSGENTDPDCLIGVQIQNAKMLKFGKRHQLGYSGVLGGPNWDIINLREGGHIE
ncbi:hypothetical protein ARMGADRAFT_1032954 [Armillaria gallica]|uniref:Uncharacterized protein n=1 Tax=Armillaria gallica TaxID=47427 RepID=A0A2H3DG95_ARMGA|nr:hypothetical protein ARMGADRAFT_1032954 [Armillaria gallica]